MRFNIVRCLTFEMFTRFSIIDSLKRAVSWIASTPTDSTPYRQLDAGNELIKNFGGKSTADSNEIIWNERALFWMAEVFDLHGLTFTGWWFMRNEWSAQAKSSALKSIAGVGCRVRRGCRLAPAWLQPKQLSMSYNPLCIFLHQCEKFNASY